MGKTGKVKRRRSICVRLVWFCGWKNIAGCKRRGLMSLDGCLVSCDSVIDVSRHA